MKRFILALILTLAFYASDCFALNLRPYMQTPPEVQTFAKRVIEDGGQVVDLEYCQKLTRLVKQLDIWGNVKFLGDANFGVKLNGSGVTKFYDLSGNNNDATQGTGANQPIWTAAVQGGRAGLVFTAANKHYLSLGNDFNLTDTRSLFFVVPNKGVATSYLWANHNVTDEYALLGFPFVGANFEFCASADHQTIISISTLPTSFLLASILNWNNSTHYINGGSGVSITNTNHYTLSGGMTVIGRAGAYDNYYYNGKISGVIDFNTTLSTAQRMATETFLNAYYSIY